MAYVIEKYLQTSPKDAKEARSILGKFEDLQDAVSNLASGSGKNFAKR